MLSFFIDRFIQFLFIIVCMFSLFVCNFWCVFWIFIILLVADIICYLDCNSVVFKITVFFAY